MFVAVVVVSFVLESNLPVGGPGLDHILLEFVEGGGDLHTRDLSIVVVDGEWVQFCPSVNKGGLSIPVKCIGCKFSIVLTVL